MSPPSYTVINAGAKAIADQVTANLNTLTPAPNPALLPANDAGLVAIADAIVGAYAPQARTYVQAGYGSYASAATWYTIGTWTVTPAVARDYLVTGQVSGYVATAGNITLRLVFGAGVIASGGFYFNAANQHSVLPMLQGVASASLISTPPVAVTITLQVMLGTATIFQVSSDDVASFGMV